MQGFYENSARIKYAGQYFISSSLLSALSFIKIPYVHISGIYCAESWTFISILITISLSWYIILLWSKQPWLLINITHAYRSLILYTPMILTLLIVPFIYFKNISHLFQSPSVLKDTLVQKYATVSSRTGLYLLVIYISLALTEWEFSVYYSLSS